MRHNVGYGQVHTELEAKFNVAYERAQSEIEMKDNVIYEQVQDTEFATKKMWHMSKCMLTLR